MPEIRCICTPNRHSTHCVGGPCEAWGIPFQEKFHSDVENSRYVLPFLICDRDHWMDHSGETMTNSRGAYWEGVPFFLPSTSSLNSNVFPKPSCWHVKLIDIWWANVYVKNNKNSYHQEEKAQLDSSILYSYNSYLALTACQTLC